MKLGSLKKSSNKSKPTNAGRISLERLARQAL